MESMDVASRRGQQEVGVASGWNIWAWLECIGVVSGYCCKEVILISSYTCKRYSIGACLSGCTRYWCNRSVITRCNLAVSDMYVYERLRQRRTR